jgi:predicted nuclease of restriction endonuclease-like (RecB) superfamily
MGEEITKRLSVDMIEKMELDTASLVKQLPIPQEENLMNSADLLIRQPLATELQTADNEENTIQQSLTAEFNSSIWWTPSAKLDNQTNSGQSSIRQPVGAEFQTTDNHSNIIEITAVDDLSPIGSTDLTIRRTPSAEFTSSIRRPLAAELQVLDNDNDTQQWQVPAYILLAQLPYGHLNEIAKLDSPVKRAFYAMECAKGQWSRRELERQINTLYFERSGLSKNREALSAMVNQRAVQLQPKDIINTPITLEFLNLSDKALVTEDDLEQSILDNIQDFLLEMGHGFCFEARQKRILIDDEYFFVDLLFYHRILKCHVVIELKVDKFKHEYASQLNMYLHYFKFNEATKDDNPPVGILFCAEKGHEQVRYATAGMDEGIFVSKYMVELPNIDLLKNYLAKELQEAQLASELRHLKNKSKA